MTMLADRIRLRETAAATAEETTERVSAIQELHATAAELERVAPPLTAAVNAAETDCQTVRIKAAKLVENAENSVRQAHQNRNIVVRPLEAKIERLRSLLERDLCHSAIANALECVAEISEQARLRYDADPARSTRLAEWCAQTAVALRDLRFSMSPDVAADVEALLSSQSS